MTGFPDVLIFTRVKQVVTIGLLLQFLFVSIIMPYGNFEDNFATRLLYNAQQRHDPDFTFTEFVFDRLLCIGELFEQDDDEDTPALPFKDPQPVQALHIQAGFMTCDRLANPVEGVLVHAAKPGCLFRETKLGRDYAASIFHPPARRA